MKLHALVCFYDEPTENVARCLAGLHLAGVDHVIAVDGAYALYPDGKGSSLLEQHAMFMVCSRTLGMACTMHIPSDVWHGGEVEKRTYMFALAQGMAQDGDWLFVVDADEFITDAPSDLRDHLQATDLDVGEVTITDMIAVAANRKDWPPDFQARRLFRAQPIVVDTTHATYVTFDGRYLWAHMNPSLEEPALPIDGLRMEHHPNARPSERLAAKMGYYGHRDNQAVELGTCDWCDDDAVRLVTTNWVFNEVLERPTGEWHQACDEHAAEAVKVGRAQLTMMGINPDTVQVEHRNGRPPVPAT